MEIFTYGQVPYPGMRLIVVLVTRYLHTFWLSGMNNKETIDQVERGYRMANPVHIVYPESKTHPKEVAQSQSNVYKVQDHSPPSSRPS